MRVLDAIDETGEADVDFAMKTLNEVAGRYGRLGLEVTRPVTLVLENMPIMGATETTPSGFRVHLGVHAVKSGMLDGLIAHEM